MAYSLYTWDKIYGTGKNSPVSNPTPSQLLGWDYYYSMAFGGLYYKDTNGNWTETESFKALVPDSAKRQTIKNILANEASGNSLSKGKKCQ